MCPSKVDRASCSEDCDFCCVVEGIDGEVQAPEAMAVMVVPHMHTGRVGGFGVKKVSQSWRSVFGSQQSARRWTENSFGWARHR